MDLATLLLAGVLGFFQAAPAPRPSTEIAPPKITAEDEARRYQQRLNMGLARLEVGDLASAHTILEGALEEDPDSLRAGLYFAELLRREDPTTTAPMEKVLRDLHRRHPEAAEPLLRLGVVLRDAGELEKAEELLHEGLASFPDDPRFLHVLGTVRMRRGEKDAGFRLLEQAAAALPNHRLIQRDLGIAMVEQGFPGQALKILSNLRTALPRDPELLRALAGLYEKLGDAERADDEARLADFYESGRERAERRAENRRELSRRIDALESEAEGDAPRPGLFAELWDLYNRRGDMGWNLTRMEQLARRHPDSLGAQAALGRVLVERGEAETLIGAGTNEVTTAAEEAERLLLGVLEKQPDHDLALDGLAALYGRRQDGAKLLGVAEGAVEARPESAVAHLHLGRAKLLSGDEEGAVAELRRALELDPDQLDALLMLANVLRRSGEADQARPLLTRALVVGPDVPRVLMALGLAAFQDGNDDDAWTLLRQAEDLGARHPSLYSALATLHSRRGFDDAASYYREMARRAQGEPAPQGF